MFDTFTISSKEADLAYMECTNLIGFSIDEGFITAFTEAGDPEKKKSLGSQVVQRVKDLAQKILKFFQDLVDSAKAKLLGKKLKENPKALENKKAEVLDLKKIMVFRSSYKKKIENAKSIEEVDAIVAEYEKKNKVAAVATVSTALTALGALILNGRLKSSSDKIINDLNAECEKRYNEMMNLQDNGASSIDVKMAAYKYKQSEKDRDALTKKNRKGELAAKKHVAFQRMISDDMKSVKEYFSSVVSKVSTAIPNAKLKKAGKKAGKEISKEIEASGYVLGKDGSVDLEATAAAQPVGESVEDSFFGDDFSSFEEAFDDLTFFGDDLFEESGLSDVGKKVSNAIKVLIEKIKKLYEEIKSKMEVAKIRAILGTKTAKSTIKIKFAINDKNITKTVGLYMKAYNNSIVEVKKIEKKFTSGKITVDEMNAELDREEAKFYTEVSRISSTNAASKVNPDEHEARVISEYLGNLTKYQDKVVYELNKSIQDELTRLQKEAEAAERAKLQKEAEEKKKVANAVAKRNKKILAVVISAIGLTGAVALFATQIKKKSSTESTFNESVEEIEGMFAESAEIGSEDAFFGEEIFGNLDASGDTEF